MEFELQNRHLVELYEKGRSKKYRLQPGVLKKFFMRIQQIEAAQTIYDFWRTPSMNFEKLQGHENRYSMRIEDKFRLELEIEWKNEEKTIGKVLILDISCHYGD